MKILKKSISIVLVLTLSGILASGAFAAKAKNKKNGPKNTAEVFAKETYNDGKIAPNAKVTVSPPKVQNGSKEDAWIPIFVQGQLSADFQNNSDFSVIDRMAAEQIAGEQQVKELTASMQNGESDIQYAQLIAADYSVSVMIVNKGGDYALDCKVISVSKSQPVGKAYVNPNVSKDALTDGSEIHKAAYELLSGMEVPESRLAKLKEQTVAQNAAQTTQTAAQVNLSKGIALDRNGMSVEAMTYYLKAAGEDKKLREAAQRLSVTSAKVSSGNFGVEAENKIKFRNQWVELLKQTTQTLEKNPPFIFKCSTVEPLELEEENYKNNTQSFALKCGLYFSDEIEIIDNFWTSLYNIPESKKWGEEVNDFPDSLASDNSWMKGGVVCVTLSLRDENKTILQTSRQFFYVTTRSIWLCSAENSCTFDYSRGVTVEFKEIPIETIKSTDALIVSVDKVEIATGSDMRKNAIRHNYRDSDTVIVKNVIPYLKKSDINVMTVYTSDIKAWGKIKTSW